MAGYESEIRLRVPPRVVERWLLDFDHIAPDRPAVLEARLVRSEGDADAWIARFVFRGALGVDPTATTRTTRRIEGRDVVLEFRAIETSFGLSDLFGSYRIRSDGAGGTVLIHRLFIVSPFVTRAGREADAREDAEAIRARFEAPQRR